MDLFECKKFAYLVIVDYYSRFIKIAKLDKATAEAVIQCCKNIFSRHGIPDNGGGTVLSLGGLENVREA